MNNKLTLLTIALTLGLGLTGCGNDSSPTSPSLTTPQISTSSTQTTFAEGAAQGQSDPIRIRGNLFGIECNETQCLLFMRQGIVLATESTVLLQELPDGTEKTLTYQEFSDLLRLGLPIRASGSQTDSQGRLIAERVRVENEMDIIGVINVESNVLSPGAPFELAVDTVFGETITLDFQVSGAGLTSHDDFDPNTRVRVQGVVPQIRSTPYIATVVESGNPSQPVGPTPTTVSQVLSGAVVGEVALRGTITSQVDNDEFLFSDGTGEIRLDFNSSGPLPAVGQKILAVGVTASSEIDVSSWQPI